MYTYLPTQACRPCRLPWHTHILTDQLTLTQSREADYAHHINTGYPRIFRPSYGPAKYLVLALVVETLSHYLHA